MCLENSRSSCVQTAIAASSPHAVGGHVAACRCQRRWSKIAGDKLSHRVSRAGLSPSEPCLRVPVGNIWTRTGPRRERASADVSRAALACWACRRQVLFWRWRYRRADGIERFRFLSRTHPQPGATPREVSAGRLASTQAVGTHSIHRSAACCTCLLALVRPTAAASLVPRVSAAPNS